MTKQHSAFSGTIADARLLINQAAAAAAVDVTWCARPSRKWLNNAGMGVVVVDARSTHAPYRLSHVSVTACASRY